MRLRSKILFLILLFTPLARLLAQDIPEPLKRHISIQMDSTTVESFLEKLVADNELFFSYNPDLLPSGKRNFSVIDLPLGKVLAELLPDSLYKVSLIERQLIITRVEPKPFKLSGRVVEKDGKTAVPYASVTIEETYIGTMTNREGYFDLTIPAIFRHRNIAVGSLGYKQKIISLNEIENNILIKLESESFSLREILVKPADPLAILNQFRENIEKNYTTDPQLMVTFYRETARQDGNYVGVWEAVMEILKPPYNENYSERVRFIKGRKADKC